MNEKARLVAGKLLGEMYAIQREIGICQVSDGRIYGLINGIEEEIEEEIGGLSLLSKQKVKLVCDELDPYYQEERPMEELNKLEVRLKVERKGVSEGEFYTILDYLKSKNMYTVEINKMNNA